MANPFSKLKKVDVPIYGQRIYLVKDRETFAACCDWIGIEFVDCNGVSVQFENDGHTFILMGVFDGGAKVLAHEAAHAAFQILDLVGVDALEGNNEALCYLVGYIFEEAEKKGILNG